MIESAEKSQKDVESDKAKLLAEIDQLKQDVRTAKQQANEEKSLKLFSESKLRDVESRLKTIESDSDSRIDSLKAQNNEYAAMIKRFTQQVEDLEQQLADAELSLNSTARRVGVLDDENARLKVF
jgi:chromosome segregation ATPase